MHPQYVDAVLLFILFIKRKPF